MPKPGTKEGLAAPFVLAPLAEQKQIAAKLDELLAQVDTIKARLDAIPKTLKRFRHSVLASAVNGRLTEGWREENHVSVDSWKEITLSDIVKKIEAGGDCTMLDARLRRHDGGLRSWRDRWVNLDRC